MFLKKYYNFNFIIFSLYFFLLLWFSPNLSFYIHSPDHGIQIAAGKLILLGEIPYRDFFWGNGPLVAYTSALCQLLNPSLIGESLICSLGYALSLYLIYYLISKHTTIVIGVIASLIGFLLLARFYKWWYWLFPLLALYCIYKLISGQTSNNSKWICISGIVCGIGALYRYELGAAFCILFLLFFLFSGLYQKHPIINFLKNSAIFLTFFSVCLLTLVYYVITFGWTLPDFLLLLHDMAIGNHQYWSLPVPSIEFEEILSYQSIIAIIFRIIPLSLIFGIIYSLAGLKYQIKYSSKYSFLLFSSIIGLLIFPQALNRADYGHLLQVIPPAIIAVSILLFDLWKKGNFVRDNYADFGIKVIILIYIMIMLISSLIICQQSYIGGGDLDKVDLNGISKLSLIYKEKIDSLEGNQYVSLINAAKSYTSNTDTVLIIPPIHQLYYFIDRPMSGMTFWYGPGCYDQFKWRNLNFERILQNPPKIVIIKNDFSDGFTNYKFNEYQPELSNYIISNYNKSLLQTPDYTILTSPSGYLDI